LLETSTYFWIDELYDWANNNISDLQYVEDDTLDDHGKLIFQGFWVGLPRDKKTLLELDELDLSWHNCKKIPNQIRYLTKLKVFRFAKSSSGLQPSSHDNADGYNRIDEIPDWISELVNLEELDLSGNEIEFFPNTLNKLVNLKRLYLHDNKINTFEESCGVFQELKVIWLQGNKFA
jgi:hypothetical protein